MNNIHFNKSTPTRDKKYKSALFHEVKTVIKGHERSVQG